MEVEEGAEGGAAGGTEDAEDGGVLLRGQEACLDNGDGAQGWMLVRQRQTDTTNRFLKLLLTDHVAYRLQRLLQESLLAGGVRDETATAC